MTKRDTIAWQLFAERNGPTWLQLRDRLPRFLAIGFARFVSARFMGGAERGFSKFFARLAFLAVAYVVHPVFKRLVR